MQGYGAVNAFGNIRYDQTKCFEDVFLADLKASGQTKFWLETCNVHAAASAIEAVGGKFKYDLPPAPDKSPIYSQAGLIFLLLYSRYGQANNRSVAAGLCENEDRTSLAWAIPQIADVTATIITAKNSYDLIVQMDASLKRGSANMLSYLTDYGTGHFINQVWRDPIAKTFTSMDSWSGNVHCKRGGDHEVYGDNFFAARCTGNRLQFIEIHKA